MVLESLNASMVGRRTQDIIIIYLVIAIIIIMISTKKNETNRKMEISAWQSVSGRGYCISFEIYKFVWVLYGNTCIMAACVSLKG